MKTIRNCIKELFHRPRYVGIIECRNEPSETSG